MRKSPVAHTKKRGPSQVILPFFFYVITSQWDWHGVGAKNLPKPCAVFELYPATKSCSLARPAHDRDGRSDVAIEDRNLEMVRVDVERRLGAKNQLRFGSISGHACIPPRTILQTATSSLLSFVFEHEEALGEVVMQLEAWRTNITYGILMQSQHVEAIERIVRRKVGILDMVGGMDLGNIKARKRLLEPSSRRFQAQPRLFESYESSS